MQYCSFCGAQQDDRANYCNVCGHPLTPVSAPASAPVQTPSSSYGPSSGSKPLPKWIIPAIAGGCLGIVIILTAAVSLLLLLRTRPSAVKVPDPEIFFGIDAERPDEDETLLVFTTARDPRDALYAYLDLLEQPPYSFSTRLESGKTAELIFRLGYTGTSEDFVPNEDGEDIRILYLQGQDYYQISISFRNEFSLIDAGSYESLAEPSSAPIQNENDGEEWTSSLPDTDQEQTSGEDTSSLFGKAEQPTSSGEEQATLPQTESKPQTDKLPSSSSQETSAQPESSQAQVAPITKTLVTDPLTKDPLDYTITSDSVYIQDLVDFCDGLLSYEASSTSGNYLIRNFSGAEEDRAIVDEYVATICNGNYNLSLAVEYDETLSSTFFSWGIDYTGTGSVRSTTDITYTDAQSTIRIYGTIKRGDMDVHVWIPMEMDIVDLGLRYGGANKSIRMAGTSAKAGLYRYSDGSFETTDGRLRTSLGQATVIRDGTVITAPASFVRDSSVGRDELWVRDFYRDETLFFCAPQNRLITGQVYTLRDLIQEQSRLNREPSEVLKNADDFTSRTWTLFFGAGHDGDFITPLLTNSAFKDLTVRVMYWNKDVEAVYYIYAEFYSAPYVVEALCAVDLNGGASTPQADGTYTMSVGQTIPVGCFTVFDTNYETFRWEIVEGGNLIELSGTSSETCSVTARQAGTARIRVHYEYGVDEPDVLTGILRNVHRGATQDYLIVVEN